jgi:hypothetical protein
VQPQNLACPGSGLPRRLGPTCGLAFVGMSDCGSLLSTIIDVGERAGPATHVTIVLNDASVRDSVSPTTIPYKQCVNQLARTSPAYISCCLPTASHRCSERAHSHGAGCPLGVHANH